MGEWRWQAGWTKLCPQDLGWLQPSVIITSQDIPVGGFPEPAAGFVAKWGIELLFRVYRRIVDRPLLMHLELFS